MINKDNTFLERKQWNHPEAVNEALDSLPSNYVKQAQIVLEQWKVGSSLKLRFISHV
jgi:hypothetical protein